MHCLQKDVQDLAHAVELPRQSSVDSLRVANGNIVTALKVSSVCIYGPTANHSAPKFALHICNEKQSK